MKKLLVLLMVAVLSLNIAACTNSNTATQSDSGTTSTSSEEVKMMTGDELVGLLGDTGRFADAILIDVRKADAYAEGHIDGAINISLDEFESRLSELEAYKDKEVVLYCNSGKMSGEAGKILVDNGFTKVYNAAGVKEYEYNLVSESKAEVKMMTGEEVVSILNDPQRLSNTLIVDVRKADAYAEGHIPGAINISLDEFESRLSELEGHKDKEIVLYCNSGKMSGEAGNILVENGYMNVYNAAGVKEFSYDLAK